VRDKSTGEISKPFTIGEKKYQMVRGITPSKKVVVGVYCHNDMDKNGDNIIHPIEYFEEHIANPMKEQIGMVGQDIQVIPNESDYVAKDSPHSKDSFINYLNLTDLDGANHFFVNTKNGQVISKFKTTKEMVKSGKKLGVDEDYMDRKSLKSFRFGSYFKHDDVSEGELSPEDAGTNIPKLQADVKKLAGIIKNKFSVYLNKLNKPIEQTQFLEAMANEIGVPLNKLSTMINTYKDLKLDASTQTSENRVITKKELEENVTRQKLLKLITSKELHN